ncbi:putative RNA-directed DNA polymerase, eukaryota, reverse transcriptase zinc-binding domain protein [Tanacetum coccineum]
MTKVDYFLISDDVLHSNIGLKVVPEGRCSLKDYEKWVVISDLEQSKPLHTKLKDLKTHLKLWYAQTKEIEANRKNYILATLRDLDKKIDDDHATNVDRTTRINRMQELEDLENLESMDLAAVWDCGRQKTPGLDGYSFMFIKKLWDLLKHDIQSFVVYYRPISLIGIHYKIVAKILANRLSKVIDSIISPEQYAFIKGRQILDDPLILSETIDWYKKLLDKLGFGIKWRNWIKAGLTSAGTSILINAILTSEYSLKRGLRQGDPLSPFLFIIVMEGLYMDLNDDLAANMLHGIKVGSLDLVMSDSEHFTVSYTSISSDSDPSAWGILLMDADEVPEIDPYEEVSQQGQVAPPSPAYAPDTIELEDHVPMYAPDPEEDLEEDPDEDPVDYAADADNDEEEEEGEEHLAPADSTAVASPGVDPIPSAEEIELFETDEYVATPPPPPAYPTTLRMSVRSQAPIPFPSEAEVARLLTLPTPPPSPLTPLSSPLP